MDDDRILTYPAQVDGLVRGIGVIKHQHPVAQVVNHRIDELDLRSVHPENNILIGQQEALFPAADVIPDFCDIDLTVKLLKIEHHDAGINIGRIVHDPQAYLVDQFEKQIRVGASDIPVAFKIFIVQAGERVDDDDIRVQIQNAVQIFRQQQRESTWLHQMFLLKMQRE